MSKREMPDKYSERICLFLEALALISFFWAMIFFGEYLEN